MPRTNEEQAGLWRLAAEELTKTSMCNSQDVIFASGYLGAANEDVRVKVGKLMRTIEGPGSGEKMRSVLGGGKFPIPQFSQTRYSRMQPCECLAGIYMSLGLNEVSADDMTHLFSTIKEHSESKELYVPLAGLTFPNDGPNQGKFEAGIVHWFSTHGLPADSAVHAITGRLYQGKSTIEKDALLRSRTMEMATTIMEVGTKICQIEEVRATLKALSDTVFADMASNLESFKLEAEDSDSGSDGEDDSAEARKKQKVMDKDENGQTVHVTSIEAKKGRGLKDTREERLAPFKGQVDPHFFELWYSLLFDVEINAYSRMLKTVAPHYSEGAMLSLWGPRFRFDNPSKNAERDTIITQKINNMSDGARRDKMKSEYLQVHDLALEVNEMTKKLSLYITSVLTMSLCFEDKDGNVLCEIFHDDLEVIQKVALFNVFMANIWKPSEADEAGQEGEEPETESESGDDEEDEEYEECESEDGELSDDSDESDDVHDSEDEHGGDPSEGSEYSDSE